jgi:hypothetical protein
MGVTSQLVDEYWERVLKSRVGVRTILRQGKSNVGREGVVLGEGRAELYAARPSVGHSARCRLLSTYYDDDCIRSSQQKEWHA